MEPSFLWIPFLTLTTTALWTVPFFTLPLGIASLTAITIVGCMYTLSVVMKSIPVGITYASFAGLCIIATSLVGIYKFNQIPDIFTIIGLLLIIVGVLIVNLIGKTY